MLAGSELPGMINFLDLRRLRQGLIWALLMSFCGAVAAEAQETPPEVRLRWIKKGSQTIDQESILISESEAGSIQVVLQISVIPGSQGLHEYGFSLRWDEDGQDELDYVSRQLSTSIPIQDFGVVPGSPETLADSSPGKFGQLGSFRACTNAPTCVFGGNDSSAQSEIVVGTVTFAVNEGASGDLHDVRAGIYRAPPELWWVDSGQPAELCDTAPCNEITFGTATILPEPSAALLQATACLAIAGLARRFGRA